MASDYQPQLLREGQVVVNAQAQPVARGVSGLVATTIVTHAVR
jgi:hypothetical protein